MRAIYCFVLAVIVMHSTALEPVGEIKLFPNTENSPSLYIIEFTLSTALPSNSYLLVGMDWYSADVEPHQCLLVNTSISVQCTNFASPSFTITATTATFAKFNDKLSAGKVVIIEVQSNLLPNTTYALQIHLKNVVPNIQKISPSIEMYTMSASGLIYEENRNMGAVINSKPNTNLLTVSILNTLSANSPGASSILRAEVTISQSVSTDLSTFLFTCQHPFSFSAGSIPTTI